MRIKLKRGVAVTAAAVMGLTMIPTTMFTAMAAEPIAVEMPTNLTVVFNGEEQYYTFDGSTKYSDTAELGYTIEPEDLRPSAGGDNELGGISLDPQIKQDREGQISAVNAGEYKLIAELKDGYVWKNAESGKETDEVTVNFVIQKLEVEVPELQQRDFNWNKEGSYELKYTNEEYSKYWKLDEVNSELNKTEKGTYTLYYDLADKKNTTWKNWSSNYIDSPTGTYITSYSIRECQHKDSDGERTFIDGICSICEGYEEPVRNKNGTSDYVDMNDDFYEIRNTGQFIWYLINGSGISVKLYCDVVISSDIELSFEPKNLWNDFDGQGHSISGLKSKTVFIKNNGTIRNVCLTDANWSGNFAAENIGTIESCCSLGNYGLCDTNKGTITDSYVVETSNVKYYENNEPTKNFSKGDLETGRVAYEIGGNWKQNIEKGDSPDLAPVPNPEHGTVYHYTSCKGNEVYTNFENKYPADDGHFHVAGDESGGYCTECGEAVMTPEKNANDEYEISNVAQLIWFINTESAEKAVLTKDIAVTDNWTQIPSFGKKLDGQGHSISGISCEDGGIFGTVESGAEITNLGIVDSDFSGSGVGSLCNVNNGMISNCFSMTNVPLTGSGETTNCYYLADSETADGGRTAEQFKNGAVAYELGRENSEWGQDIGTDAYPKYADKVYRIAVSTDFESDIELDDIYLNSDQDFYNDYYLKYIARLNKSEDAKYVTYTGYLGGLEINQYSTVIIIEDKEIVFSRKGEDIQVDYSKNTSFYLKYGETFSELDLLQYIGNIDELGSVTFSCGNLPDGLEITSDGRYLKGTVKSDVNDWYGHHFSVTATSEYGSETSIELILYVSLGTPTIPELPTDLSAPEGTELSSIELENGWQWANGGETVVYPETEAMIKLELDKDHYDYSGIDGVGVWDTYLYRTVSVKATLNNGILDSAGVILNGGIGLTYIFIPSEDMKNDEAAYVTVNEQKYLLSEITPQSDGSYKFTYWINAKEMGDKLVFKAFSGNDEPLEFTTQSNHDEKITEYSYSVLEYLNSPRFFSSYISTAERNLAYAMRAYGKYSQVFFNYDPEHLIYVDPSYQDNLDDVTADELEKYSAAKTGELPTGLRLSGMSVLLKSNTIARLSFKTADISKYTFKIDGEPVEANALSEEGFYSIDVKNILANDLDETHTLEVGDCKITFSALSYVASVVKNSEDAAQINASKALYLYWKAAMDYKNYSALS